MVVTTKHPELGRNRRCIISVIIVMVSVLLNGEETLGQPLYKDGSQPVELRVQDLLSRMTVQEKIGQMTQIERTVATPDVMQQYYIGSVLSGGGSAPERNTPAAWQDMIDTMQQAALATRLAIPMIYGVDAVHGHNTVYGATIFPHNIGLGCSRDPDLVKRIGAATALEVRATGIPYAFAPCIATSRDPRWGRCYESYSEDTAVVKMMTDVILGLQGEPPNLTAGVPFMADKSKVIACAKHYVGDGGTVKGINENDTIMDYDTLYKVHMAPYLDAIAKGVSTIMISYSSWNGEKMHASHYLVTQILKEQLGFQGFTISDWMGVDRLSDPSAVNYTHSVLRSINAGLDMIMVPYDYKAFIDAMTSLVNNGEISMDRIDDAVRRILRVKFVMGLFEETTVDRSFTNYLGSQEHRVLAREAIRKSLVLLKNGQDGSEALLPLKKNATSILVAGSHANDIGFQCGGWTISWEGSAGNTTIGTTVLDAIKAAVSPTTVVTYEKNPAPGFAAQLKPDYAIVVVGEPPYVETRGDSLELTIPLDGISTIQNVCAEVKCLVIVISGRPVVIEPYMTQIDALVAAWLPGTEGDGISDVIFGDYDFVGKLSRTWFRTPDQLPMNFGDAVYDPLFPFDFGLTMGTKESV
ncbi:hypothetical protein Mapa_014561 [Marchantia paleacea]|nr:hypothetical protein Mapa_014561 [Marchantia paleacea]